MNKYSFFFKYTGESTKQGTTRHYWRLNFQNPENVEWDFVQRLISRTLCRPHKSEIRNFLEDHFVYRQVKGTDYAFDIMLIQPTAPRSKQFNYSDDNHSEED